MSQPSTEAPPRSSRREIRNPILALPAVREILSRPPDQPITRRELGTILREVATQCDVNAERAWRRRKAPMAAYWRATCTYAKHLARALDRRARAPIARSEAA